MSKQRWLLPPALLVLLAANSASSATDDHPVKPLSIPGIENAYRLSPRLFSGGKPEGEAAFEALEALGVKTIVSVDGAATDVAAAQAHGMRYVHLPVGYDGIDSDSAARLVKLMQTLPGPVFVHCHHGKHRGPAAAGLCAIAAEGWTKTEARAWLKQAGTSADYQGLYESVDLFQMPDQAVLDKIDPAHDLPAQAELPGLVELMVEVDAAWDQLKSLDVGSDTQPPKLIPADAQALSATALLLAEHYREAARLPEVERKGVDFLNALADAEHAALDLQTRLKLKQPVEDQAAAQVKAAAKLAGQTCVNCHRRFRD